MSFFQAAGSGKVTEYIQKYSVYKVIGQIHGLQQSLDRVFLQPNNVIHKCHSNSSNSEGSQYPVEVTAVDNLREIQCIRAKTDQCSKELRIRHFKKSLHPTLLV